jgi:hypothetical protein
MDKRSENGGHSTKALGVDKRKNKYLELLDQASTPEEIVSVIRKLKEIALIKGDVQAIKLFLEYYLGKPKETIETTHNLNEFNIKELFKFDNNKTEI